MVLNGLFVTQREQFFGVLDHGNQRASLRRGALPARTLSVEDLGGHPGPRAPILRAVRGLASCGSCAERFLGSSRRYRGPSSRRVPPRVPSMA